LRRVNFGSPPGHLVDIDLFKSGNPNLAAISQLSPKIGDIEPIQDTVEARELGWRDLVAFAYQTVSL